MKWQPIETADGLMEYVKVDLWVRHSDGTGHREANAYRVGRYWNTSSGKWAEGRSFRDDEGEECFDPDDRGPKAFVVTHWMQVEPPQ